MAGNPAPRHSPWHRPFPTTRFRCARSRPGENKIRHHILLIALLFLSSEAYSQDKYPWIMTPKAQKELDSANKAPLWAKIDNINIGYSESEDIKKIQSDFEESYANYKSTNPDIDSSNAMSMTMRETDLKFLLHSFESNCRTFLKFPTKPSGTITYNSGSEIPMHEVCKVNVLAFVLNDYKFKKAKRERTLVLEK